MHEHLGSYIIIMHQGPAFRQSQYHIMRSDSHTSHYHPAPFPIPIPISTPIPTPILSLHTPNSLSLRAIDQPYDPDPTWTTLGEDVTQTIKRTSSNKKKNTSSYNQVHALLINWEADDLDTYKEINDLQQLFEQNYFFNVERWSIPSCGSSNELEIKIFQFRLSHADPSDLLIVYYGGHGHKNDANRSIWVA